MIGVRSCGRRESRNDGSAGIRYRAKQFRIRPRVIDIDSRSNECVRRGSAPERGSVRHGVDSRSSARNRGNAASRKIGNETFRYLNAVRRRLSRTDYRDAKDGFRQRSTDVENVGTTRKVGEFQRILLIGCRQNLYAIIRKSIGNDPRILGIVPKIGNGSTGSSRGAASYDILPRLFEAVERSRFKKLRMRGSSQMQTHDVFLTHGAKTVSGSMRETDRPLRRFPHAETGFSNRKRFGWTSGRPSRALRKNRFRRPEFKTSEASNRTDARCGRKRRGNAEEGRACLGGNSDGRLK